MAQRTGATRTSGWITDCRREALYIRDGYICQYCGADLSGVDCDGLTLDHLVCHSTGMATDGRPDNTNGNLITCCHACNSQRGARDWRDYAPGGAQERIERQVVVAIDLAFAKTVTVERRAARYVRKITKATKAA